MAYAVQNVAVTTSAWIPITLPNIRTGGSAIMSCRLGGSFKHSPTADGSVYATCVGALELQFMPGFFQTGSGKMDEVVYVQSVANDTLEVVQVM